MNSNDSTRIRQAGLSDLGILQELVHHTIDISYSAVYPPRAVLFFKEFPSAEKILQRYRHGAILVAEKDGKIISLITGRLGKY
jgi:hypothetical protein